MPRHPPPSHTRLPSDGASDPRPAALRAAAPQRQLPGVDLYADDANYPEPFAPYIVARAAVGGACLVHRSALPCDLCFAAEVYLLDTRATRKAGAL